MSRYSYKIKHAYVFNAYSRLNITMQKLKSSSFLTFIDFLKYNKRVTKYYWEIDCLKRKNYLHEQVQGQIKTKMREKRKLITKRPNHYHYSNVRWVS